MSARLREGYRALVLGATGALGEAFAHALAQDPRCAQVVSVGRTGTTLDTGSTPVGSLPTWDLKDEASLVALAAALTGPFHLVIDATGALTLDGRGPEKRLADVDAQGLANSLLVNAIGPVLLLRHISPLLARGERVVWAKLSARVGSIQDNHKGGWYSYRMAKAALNQGLQTAAIELARQQASPSLELRAIQPIIELHHRRGDLDAAHELVRTVVDKFPADSSGRDLDRARAALEGRADLRPTLRFSTT